MKRYLIITTLDVLRQSNNREHHLLEHLGPRFDEVYVVFRRRCDGRGFGARLADAMLPWARMHRQGNIRYIEVNPLLNHVQGLAMDIAGTYTMQEDSCPSPAGVRQSLFRLLSGLGLFKDMSTILFLFLFTLWYARGHFDACTAMGPWGNAVAWGLKRLGRIGRWCYADRDYEPGFITTPVRRRWAERLEIGTLKRADRRISIGYRLARLRRRQTGQRVEIITTGVDIDRFQPRHPSRTPSVLVYTGNVTFWSGLEYLIAGLAALARDDLRLWIVGDGLAGYRRRLEGQVQRLGLSGRVRFLGRVENREVPAILARADIGIATFQPLSFRRYALPLKVLEYMASGLPVLGTAGTETEDLLNRHRCGICVPFAAADMAFGVQSLLADAEGYAAMVRRAQGAIAEYDWTDLMAREYALLTGEPGDTAREVPA